MPVLTQFLQISTVLPPGSSVYGLGENTGPFELSSDPDFYRMSLFARDTAPGVRTPIIVLYFLVELRDLTPTLFLRAASE